MATSTKPVKDGITAQLDDACAQSVSKDLYDQVAMYPVCDCSFVATWLIYGIMVGAMHVDYVTDYVFHTNLCG